jgi:hypothetical protein
LEQFVGEACGEVFALGIRNFTAFENGHHLVPNDWIADPLSQLRHSSRQFHGDPRDPIGNGNDGSGNDDAAGEDAALNRGHVDMGFRDLLVRQRDNGLLFIGSIAVPVAGLLIRIRELPMRLCRAELKSPSDEPVYRLRHPGRQGHDGDSDHKS